MGGVGARVAEFKSLIRWEIDGETPATWRLLNLHCYVFNSSLRTHLLGRRLI